MKSWTQIVSLLHVRSLSRIWKQISWIAVQTLWTHIMENCIVMLISLSDPSPIIGYPFCGKSTLSAFATYNIIIIYWIICSFGNICSWIIPLFQRKHCHALDWFCYGATCHVYTRSLNVSNFAPTTTTFQKNEVGAQKIFRQKKWQFFHQKWWFSRWITENGDNIGERTGDIFSDCWKS